MQENFLKSAPGRTQQLNQYANNTFYRRFHFKQTFINAHNQISIMNIRTVELKDLNKCVELLDLPELTFPSGKAPHLKYVKAYVDSGLFFVAEENSEVIGCIFGETLKDHGSMLWYFVVDIKFRSKGIGQKMLSYYEAECKKQNISWVVLYAPTISKKSLEFYEKMGYDKGKSFTEFSKKLK